LAHYVRPEGRIYSYEIREEFQKTAEKNLLRAGLRDFVELKNKDVTTGIEERDVDAVILDLAIPWLVISHAFAALKPSGTVVSFSPTIDQSSPSLLQMPTRIATLLERWLQAMLTKTVNKGLILFDGSLTSGTPDTPVRRLKEILTNGRNRSNTVLAFSKMTNLRVNGCLITDLVCEHKPPYLIETAGLRPKPPMVLLGDVYVAKLSKGNCAFRLDIDRDVPCDSRVEAVERLIGNDLLTQSYPETLRLAHILCTFTANEVLAMQHFISRRCGLQLINRPDMHRLLFGPFGKGESYS
jgi:hypothetical protein